MTELWPFIKLMRSQSKMLILGFLLGLITLLAGTSLLATSGYLICGAAFAGLTSSSAMAFNYFTPAACIRFFAMVRIAGRYGERVTTHSATFRILADLRSWLYSKIEPLAPAHLLKHNSGDLLNRIISDIDALDNLYIRVLLPFAAALLLTLAVCTLFYFFNIAIAISTLCIMLFAIFIVPLIALLLGRQAGHRIIQTTSALRTDIIDTYHNLTDLLLFSAADKQLKKVHKTQTALIQQQKKMSNIKGFSIALITLLSGFAIWLALYLGIPFVYHNKLNGAVLGMIILTIMAAFEAINPLPIAFQYLGKTAAAAKRLNAIAATKPTVTFVAESSETIKNVDITFRNVNFHYPQQAFNVLENFNLHIAAKEKVMLLGPTGAGKTTLMQLLTRCWDPLSGETLLGDIPIKNLAESDLRKTISIVPQQIHMFNASVRDNLCIGKQDADDSELWNVLQLLDLDNTIRALPKQLDTTMGEFGMCFSGGQIKRFAIARALLHNAPIMIFDEPTEGLDDTTSQQIWQALQTILENKTVIVITHQPEHIGFFDRVIQL